MHLLEDLQIQKEADVQDVLVCPISLPLQLQRLIYVLETAAEVVPGWMLLLGLHGVNSKS